MARETHRVPKSARTDRDVLHRQAQAAALTALIAGEPVSVLLDAVAGSDVRGWFTPDVAVLELAATALELACPADAEPLQYEGLRERYLPEMQFRGRNDHHRSQYALYAAACMRGGLQPDLLNDAGLWDPRLWVYAVYALVIYCRAAAERRHTQVADVALDLADRHRLREEVERLRRADQTP